MAAGVRSVLSAAMSGPTAPSVGPKSLGVAGDDADDGRWKGSVDVNTSSTQHHVSEAVLRSHDRLRKLGLSLVGGMFLVSAGIHIGIVSADAQQYRHFADGAMPWVRTAWRDVFMANPGAWGLAVAAGELVIGTAILAGGRWTRLGLVGAIGFHVALMLFGFGFWVWSLPVLALLVALWPRAETVDSVAATDPRVPSQNRIAGGPS